MLTPSKWNDYALLATGDGDKLERWGNVILRRPDPQIIWPYQGSQQKWTIPDAHYHRSEKGGGRWSFNNRIPEEWTVNYEDLTFSVRTMGFKHTGLFPEQAVNWNWMRKRISTEKRLINVLNLFAYTGGASVACAKVGAKVCHVDASKGMVTRAKQNAELSGLADHPIRYIADDAIKFVEREIRRRNTYDAIIMDPPSFGRGPNGEIWKVEEHLFSLVELCTQLLSKNPLFFLINSYTTGFSPTVIADILQMTVGKTYKGTITCDELGVQQENSDLLLPCGIFGRWES